MNMLDKLWQQEVEFEDFCSSVGYNGYGIQRRLRDKFSVYMHPDTLDEVQAEANLSQLHFYASATPPSIFGYSLGISRAADRGRLTFMPKYLL